MERIIKLSGVSDNKLRVSRVLYVRFLSDFTDFNHFVGQLWLTFFIGPFPAFERLEIPPLSRSLWWPAKPPTTTTQTCLFAKRREVTANRNLFYVPPFYLAINFLVVMVRPSASSFLTSFLAVLPHFQELNISCSTDILSFISLLFRTR